VKRRSRIGTRLVAILALLTGAGGVFHAGDPDAADRQYRIARRLAAEGSPDAAEALRKVVELDPGGNLADDALLDEALLQPVPRWPEDLGRIDSAQASRSLALASNVVDELGRGDRVPEARYYRGLLLLEPTPRHDPSAARIDLLTVATTPEAGAWADAARYAVAWLAEQQGQIERALAAYQRVIIDARKGPATLRARVGLARLHLRDGRYGQAARLLNEVAAERVQLEQPAVALKELAVRSLLPKARSPEVEVLAAPVGVRSLAGFSTTGGGGVLIGDRKTGSVLHHDVDGQIRSRWSVDDPQVVAISPMGRVFVAAGDQVYRLEADQPPIPVSSQGDFASPADMTVDNLGRIWLLDRRGEAIGRIDPGRSEPENVWKNSEVRLVSIIWDGRRLVAVDGRSKSLVVLSADGGRDFLAGADLQRPVALAADPTGRLAVLDLKAGAVTFYDAGGEPLDRFDCRAAGIGRPATLDFGHDGSLHIFDEATAAWMRLQ
jgi:tetratricopeptide (TPR) repeat protein